VINVPVYNSVPLLGPNCSKIMEKLKFTLKIWNKLSNHVRVRDRSIKILQYGCQMLIGVYGHQLTKVNVIQYQLDRQYLYMRFPFSRKCRTDLKSLDP
jgi:hypothetical protein